MGSRNVLIMAGGTGGHIFPAKAVAAELEADGWNIHWLGTADRLEAKLVPQFGWPLHIISVSGLRGKGMLSLLKAPWMLLKSVWQARQILKNVKPVLVIGFGGYASGPGGLAAWILRLPLLIHEQNAVAGSTNRLLARLAKNVLVAFPTAFAGSEKQKVVGNPVRQELINCAANREATGALRVLIVGGSLGAKALNDTLPELLAQAAGTGKVEVRHQTGSQMQPQAQMAYHKLAAAQLQVEVCAFIEDMAAAYRWADVVICRAGASTVSELACAGVASVLVPLPNAIDDHQTANARWLTEQQAAILLPQGQLAAGLPKKLQQWLHNRDELQQMAANARRCAIDNAAAQVVAMCQQVTGQAV